MTDKSALRQHMKTFREELSARDPDAGETLAEKFPMRLFERYGPVVSAYHPIGAEIDTLPLIARLRTAGARIALPRVEDCEITFRAWDADAPLETGLFGVRQPAASAEVLRPTLVLMPLLAFDRMGNRLGYGGGYFDRALASLRGSGRAFACALAFQGQHIDRLPADDHDQPLDWAVTEAGNFPIFMMRNMANGAPNGDDAA